MATPLTVLSAQGNDWSIAGLARPSLLDRGEVPGHNPRIGMGGEGGEGGEAARGGEAMAAKRLLSISSLF